MLQTRLRYNYMISFINNHLLKTNIMIFLMLILLGLSIIPMAIYGQESKPSFSDTAKVNAHVVNGSISPVRRATNDSVSPTDTPKNLKNYESAIWSQLYEEGFNLGNILAGIVVWLIPIIIALILYHVIRRRAVKFFGMQLVDKKGEAKIVVDTYYLDNEGINSALTQALERQRGTLSETQERAVQSIITGPYIKKLHGLVDWRLPGASGPILGYCTARGLEYLIAMVSRIRQTPIDIESDYESWGSWQRSIISIGGPAGNQHSLKILNENGGYFVGRYNGIGDHGIQRKTDHATIFDEPSKCYGLIAKFHHPQSNQYRLIVCAGINDSGTSASCWYLYENWQKLYKKYGKKDFTIIIQVDRESDESAIEVQFDEILAKQNQEAHPIENSISNNESSIPNTPPKRHDGPASIVGPGFTINASAPPASGSIAPMIISRDDEVRKEATGAIAQQVQDPKYGGPRKRKRKSKKR